jgi:hypothetical protein
MNLFRSKTTIPRIVKCNKRALLLIPLVLACFALLPRAQAATPELLPSPAPDGAYTGFNTAEGLNALHNVNTAVGQFNTALGFNTLKSDTTGSHNTAVGAQALLNNNGSFNTAVGENALVSNVAGDQNMALGQGALGGNVEGNDNVAIGFQALNRNGGEFADVNVAIGSQALKRNFDGSGNVAVGFQALFNNDHGSNNIALGPLALRNVSSFSGSFNIGIGDDAGHNVSSAHNVICIGDVGGANVDNTTYIDNIFGTLQPVVGVNPDVVTIRSDGRLGRANVSSRRYKHEIKLMDKASEKLYALKPVTFRYKKEYDETQTLAYGLIAEDVAQVYPALVGRNDKGQPESVRYEQINAMLLNEFLKEHRKVEQLEKQVEALTAGLQKVSEQLELQKPSAQTVVNNQ